MDITLINGIPCAYELTAAPAQRLTLVFVHGWLLSRHYWQPLVARLATTYSCLTYDLRGFGDSQLVVSPPGTPRSHPSREISSGSPYSLQAYAQDLVDLLQALSLSNVWLVGHSLGGSIALWAAQQQPAAIAGVICLNAGGGIYLKEDFERFRSAGTQLVKYRPRWLGHVPFLDRVFARLNVASPLDRAWGQQRIRDFVTACPEAALGSLLDSTTEPEVHRLPHLVAHLQQPVYFIAGSQDDVMPPQYVRHLASFHPLFAETGQNVLELPNCGHLAMLEQPDAVATQITTIVAACCPSSHLS
ncbi:alpha/beta fold hydrolase [Trichothermofontia sp.]